ncbi:ABC-F family ATP-binding cassette domain-containing protein [Nocardia sp. NPDC127579]|uniref:ABC-F family ATP-binding cassette domain-containing protein n=1 Tax=Nocardia sp. NPDC127579 TaxID=3345402 RepID=UPI003643DA90
MRTQITAHAVSKSFGGKPVLEAVTCALTAGERTGIVGENGSGKTTLLRLFAGRVRPDEGAIVVQADGGVGYLAQEERLSPRLTVQEVIDRALAELRSIERRLRELEAAMSDDESLLAEYSRLTTVFELRGGYEADARVERALHGLGLRLVGRDRTVATLSGGEQVRLRLAAVLAAGTEVLLLDEPTNHLDDTALTWLEEHLRSRRGTTVTVSHDRTFLERIATTLLEVDADRRRVVRYGNGYRGFLAEKAAARHRWEQEYTRWRADTERLREVAATTARQVAPGRAMTDNNKMAYDRAGGRVQQSLAGRVRNAEERLRRLLADPVSPPPPPLRFAPNLRGGVGGTLLEAVDAGVEGRLGRIDLALAAGDRLLVTGPNGAGKTTLLRVLAGQLRADTGVVRHRGRVGYLGQEPPPAVPGQTLLAAFAETYVPDRERTQSHRHHDVEPTDSGQTSNALSERPIATWARARVGGGSADERHTTGADLDWARLDDGADAALLSLGLFEREQFGTRVADLSTGQRQRLALARLVSAPVDVLLLDEPTNHLSPGLIEELEAALQEFRGAIVIVSHDRRLRARWRGTQLDLAASAAV